MKTIWITFVFGLCVSTLLSINYYSGGSLNVNDVNSWWTNRNNTGSHPANFTTAGQVFYVESGDYMTASAKWTVSGTGSKVIIESGGKITTGSFNHDFTLTMRSGATYVITHTSYSYLTPDTLDVNSEIVLDNTNIGFQDDINYGNLTVNKGVADCSGPNDLTVRGTLKINTEGSFEGAQTTYSHTHSIANIHLNGGTFYGTTGAASCTFNISGNIYIQSGTFYGSDGSGGATYNVTGNVTIDSGGTLYACYRSGTNDLPYTSWNVWGSWVNNGVYYARNRAQGGYASITMKGSGSFKQGNVTNALQTQHNITFDNDSTYSLGGDLYIYSGFQLHLRGTFTAGSYIVYSHTGAANYNIYGTVITSNIYGFSGHASATLSSNYSPSITMWGNNTIVYNATTAQTITPRSDYKNLTISGSSTQTLPDNATVGGTLTLNNLLTITSGKTLTINGIITGSNTFSTGNIVIAGTAGTATLPACSIGDLTINRANGCNLSGNTIINNLILSQGQLSLLNGHLFINGNLTKTNGSMVGTNNSNLTIQSSGDNILLPALTLNSLTLNRANGATMNGNLTLNSLILTQGTLSMVSYTLTLNGMMSGAGTLYGGGTGSLIIQGGASNQSIPSIALASFTLNRSGGATLQGNMTTGNITLTAGTLNLGNNSLSFSGTISYATGDIIGSNSSILQVSGSGSQAVLPSFNISTLNINRTGGAAMGQSSQLYNLILTQGDFNLNGKTLTITGDITINRAGLIGGGSSSIICSGNEAVQLHLPSVTLSNLTINRSAGCVLTGNVTVTSTLQLNQGELTCSNYLSVGQLATINRVLGSMTGNPSFGSLVNINYQRTCQSGSENPPAPSKINQMNVFANQRLIANADFYIHTMLHLFPNSVFDLHGHSLYLSPNAQIITDSGARIIGRVNQEIGTKGFDCPAMGISIAPGVLIEGFSVTREITGPTNGIAATYKLEASNLPLSSPVTISFRWYANEDNGLQFGPELSKWARAIYSNDGVNWYPYGDPQDVSMNNPRRLDIHTVHFSDWSITTNNQTLPVVLSSFSAVPTSQYFVQLNWTTQTETNLSGYYIYRNNDNNFTNAQLISPLINATNSPYEQSYSYIDREVSAPNDLYYWLQSVELSGSSMTYDPVHVVLEHPEDNGYTPIVPENYSLSLYPNPFNPILYIVYSLKQAEKVDLSIYNTKGYFVKRIRQDNLPIGRHLSRWDGTDETGKLCSSGLYLIVLQYGKEKIIQKAVLMK